MLFAILVRRLVLLLVAVVCTFVKFCSQCLSAVLFADVQFCWYKLFAMSAVLFADVHCFVRSCCSQCLFAVLFADIQFCLRLLFAMFVCRCSVLLAAAVRNVCLQICRQSQFCSQWLFAMCVCRCSVLFAAAAVLCFVCSYCYFSYSLINFFMIKYYLRFSNYFSWIWLIYENTIRIYVAIKKSDNNLTALSFQHQNDIRKVHKPASL